MNDLPDFHHDVLTCPSCEHSINASLAVSGTEPPSPGDVTICVACAMPAVYGEGLRLREPTAEELIELLTLPDFHKAMVALADFLDKEGQQDE